MYSFTHFLISSSFKKLFDFYEYTIIDRTVRSFVIKFYTFQTFYRTSYFQFFILNETRKVIGVTLLYSTLRPFFC